MTSDQITVASASAPPASTQRTAKVFNLNSGQQAALDALLAFLDPKQTEQDEFVLSGFAGTGKTYTMQALIAQIKGRLIFTAPTNKATKVLRETLTSEDYKPDCRTIHSLLGLRMEANNEIKVLAAPEDPVDLDQYLAVVLDEAGMVGNDLKGYIDRCRAEAKIKFIYMGDPKQLNPVKEELSPIWKLPIGAELTEVMRNAGPILALATAVRQQVGLLVPRLRLPDFIDDTQPDLGTVEMLTGGSFETAIACDAEFGRFSSPTGVKVISWRNAIVDRYNKLIRQRIFDDPNEPWLPTDRVVATSPGKHLDTGDPLIYTDAEGEVIKAVECEHPLFEDMPAWSVTVRLDEGKMVGLHTLHAAGLAEFNSRKQDLLQRAKVEKRRWREYWEFVEAWHSIRHAYAITAHRSQGSTYDRVYVDWRDILTNQNRTEAYRCLYVAVSRPKKALILN